MRVTLWACALLVLTGSAPAEPIESVAMPASSSTRSSSAAPREVADSQPTAQLVGQGSLRFFGLLVYEARLWAAPGFKAESYDSQPFALELAYARKLDGNAIAERSIAEMRRVGDFSEEQSQAWLAGMRRAFPDVAAQDRLVGVYDGRGEVRFFYKGQLTAQIQDRAYAHLFFGIWLDTRTSAPALRKALLGLAP